MRNDIDENDIDENNIYGAIKIALDSLDNKVGIIIESKKDERFFQKSFVKGTIYL